MKRPSPKAWLSLAVLGGLLYPPLVYFGMNVIPPIVFIGVALALMGIRLLGLRHTPEARLLNGAFLIAALGLISMSFLDMHLAVRAYPILVSLAISALFGLSLIYPPSLAERIARLTEPNLPPEGVLYTRKVTLIWMLFLWANALVSAGTALWGTIEQWTLWNGLISYILMGTLFIGEWVFRQHLRREKVRL